MKEIIDKIKDIKFITGLLIGLVGSIWFIFSAYQSFIDKNEELYQTIKTTQQMALKSVIWNEEIPIAERASACDVYLSAGYNSLTKKECESILEKGAKEGIFSYVEGKVIIDEHSINFNSDSDSYYFSSLFAN